MRIFLLFFVLLFSCGKTTKPEEIKSISPEDFNKLDRIEERLIEYRLSQDKKILTSSKDIINEYLTNKIINKEFIARLYGLKGEIAYLENNKIELDSSINNIKEKIPHLYLLKSWKEQNNNKRLNILLEGKKEFENNPRIKLEIGLYYFENEEFGKSIPYLEESLEKLPYIYKKLYAEKKEKALKLRDINSSIDINLLTKEKLTVADVLKILLKETPLLEQFNINSIDNKIMQKLKEENLINKNLSFEETITKKDIIFLIFKLMEKNNYKDVANFYRKFPQKYREKSPIKDISPQDEWYEASLYFVIREIIDLPDGKNLLPNNPISGKDFYDMIEKIKNKK